MFTYHNKSLSTVPTVTPTATPSAKVIRDKSSDISDDQAAVTPEADNSWFAGAIGNSKIHAKFDIKDDQVTGVYYYDKYKSNINLAGSIGYNVYNINLKDFTNIDLTEDTENKGQIIGIYRNKDYIQGYWKNGEYLYAANCIGDCIEYYTNDPDYASVLPQLMIEWAEETELPVHFNYVNVK